MLESGSGASLEAQRGAVLHVHHADRTVTPYLVQESEAKTLGMMNAQAAIFSSLGAFFLTPVVGIVVNLMTSSGPSQPSDLGLKMVVVICSIASLVFYGLAGYSWKIGADTWADIKRQTTYTTEVTTVVPQREGA